MTVVSALLGVTELPLAAEFDLEGLVWQASLRAGGRADTPAYTRQLWPDVRTLALPLVIEGDDATAIEAARSQINRELAKLNTLVVTTDDGLAATFNTFPSSPLPPTAGNLYRHAGVYRGTAQVQVEPFALGATETITAAGTATPALIDLSDMVGDYPARLTVAVAPAAGQDAMHGVWLGLVPDATWDGFLVEARDVAGWDDEVADAGLGVNVVRFASGAGDDVGTIDTSDFPASAYLVLARVKAGAGTVTLATDEAGTVTTTSDGYAWTPLGELAAPTRRVRGSATADLVITGSAAGAAGYVHRLAFVPLRWGFVSWHNTASESDTCSSLRAEWQDVYVDDVVDYEHVRGGGLRTLGGGLIVVSEDATGDTLDHTVDATVTYRPRRDWLG